MNGRLRPLVSLASAVAVTALLPCAGALGAEAQTPLPGSNYGVRAACPPPSTGHAGCLALQLVPATAQARAHNRPIGLQRAAGAAPAANNPAAGNFGLRPSDLHAAYELPETAKTQQTIALIDAYNDPTAEEDLAAYSSMFSLPACTKAGGCFRKVGETGSESTLPFPATSAKLKEAEGGTAGEKEEAKAAVGWGAEISLDIESAHATCPNCHIILVEAETTSYADLEAAEKTAEALGANELSNSWGGPEAGVSVTQDNAGPFNDPNVVITASTGDNGFLGWASGSAEERGFTNYPAASPHVVAVGGTRLTLGAGSAWSAETVWNGYGASGGGCSIQFTAPAWQQAVSDWSGIGCATKRVIADVSADADPVTGIAVTDSTSACETTYTEGGVKHVIHWCTYGGTSLASPIIASVFALAGGANGVAYPARTLYENEREAPATLHDVTIGSNGSCPSFSEETGLSSCLPAEEAAASCESKGSCLAGIGFDGPSGVGTPHGILGFQPSGKEATPSEEQAKEEKAKEEERAKELEKAKEQEQTKGAAEEKAHPQEAGGAPGAPVMPPVLPPSGPPGAGTASSSPVISALNLTLRALLALDTHRPPASRVAFYFMLNSASRVHISLSRRVWSHHRPRWITVGPPATVSAIPGRNGARLRGRRALAPGLYRLSVTPLSGHSRAIFFHIN